MKSIIFFFIKTALFYYWQNSPLGALDQLTMICDGLAVIRANQFLRTMRDLENVELYTRHSG